MKIAYWLSLLVYEGQAIGSFLPPQPGMYLSSGSIPPELSWKEPGWPGIGLSNGLSCQYPLAQLSKGLCQEAQSKALDVGLSKGHPCQQDKVECSPQDGQPPSPL